MLVVVDQPATIDANLPGLAMRRIVDLFPGNARTDASDAYTIAEAASTMPHALRRVDVGDNALAELNVLVGYDDDLAEEATRVSNRIRGQLTTSTLPWSASSEPSWVS